MRLFRNLLKFVPAGAAALAAAPLWAQNVEEKAAKAGMPQLDMQFYPSQIFWLVISFALLYLIMRYVALPNVEKTQDKRHKIIANDLACAAAANEEAKAVIAQYEKALANARSEAQAAVLDITAQASKNAIEMQAQQQLVLNKRMHEAEAAIASARDAALQEAQAQAGELATAALEKITGMKVPV